MDGTSQPFMNFFASYMWKKTEAILNYKYKL